MRCPECSADMAAKFGASAPKWECPRCGIKAVSTDDIAAEARRLKKDSDRLIAQIDATLEQRGSTHGDFGENAHVALGVRAIMRGAGNWKSLKPQQQLALDEIALKVARIVSGGAPADFKEPWHDIQGYAKLGENACG